MKNDKLNIIKILLLMMIKIREEKFGNMKMKLYKNSNFPKNPKKIWQTLNEILGKTKKN